jgi:hypothetical protein
MLHPRSQRGPLQRPGRQDAAVATAVGVLEGPFGDVGDAFDVAMRMHRPGGAGDQAIIVEHAQIPEPGVLRVVVVVEAEMPIGREPAALDVMQRGAWPQGQHRNILLA